MMQDNNDIKNDRGKEMTTTAQKDCFTAAMCLLGRRDHSCLELTFKLKQRGFNKADIDRAVAKCLRLNYLDDNRYAHERIRILRRKGYGPRRIRSDLLDKGIDNERIGGALAISYAHTGEYEDCAALLLKKLRNGFSGDLTIDLRRKLYRFLLGRGFTPEAIESVLMNSRKTRHAP